MFNPDKIIKDLAEMFFANRLTLGEVVELQETLFAKRRLTLQECFDVYATETKAKSILACKEKLCISCGEYIAPKDATIINRQVYCVECIETGLAPSPSPSASKETGNVSIILTLVLTLTLAVSAIVAFPVVETLTRVNATITRVYTAIP